MIDDDVTQAAPYTLPQGRWLWALMLIFGLAGCDETPKTAMDLSGPKTDQARADIPGVSDGTPPEDGPIDAISMDGRSSDLRSTDTAGPAIDAQPADAAPPPLLQGPLKGLPSAHGAHMATIAALADDSWIELPKPAADPKWGTAHGRSWGGRSMILAPKLRGAFFFGEGRHAYVKSDGHAMDDLWFYDLNANRWIAVHPGTNVGAFSQQVKDGLLKIDANGQLVDDQGNNVPVHTLIHAWDFLSYDSDAERFAFISTKELDGQLHLGGAAKMTEGLALLRAQKTARPAKPMSPWYYDTKKGAFLKEPATNRPANVGNYSAFVYIPYLKKFFNGGSKGVQFFDPATNSWSTVQDTGPRVPGFDHGVCFDHRRKRIYMGSGQADPTGALHIYDIATKTWSKPTPQGTGPQQFRTDSASIFYDDVNDVVTVFQYDSSKIFTYKPAEDSWSSRALPSKVRNAVQYPQHHAFYDSQTNAYFLYVATDSTANGRMWVYRYKTRP